MAIWHPKREKSIISIWTEFLRGTGGRVTDCATLIPFNLFFYLYILSGSYLSSYG